MFHVKHKENNIYKELYELAIKSAKNEDVPVSSIVLYNNKIIGKGYNNRQSKGTVLGHAEVNAIKQAEKQINDWRLSECTLICTLKPCFMCAEVIRSSRIKNVFYILDQEMFNYNYDFKQIDENNEYIDKYKELFNNFFKKLR